MKDFMYKGIFKMPHEVLNRKVYMTCGKCSGTARNVIDGICRGCKGTGVIRI